MNKPNVTKYLNTAKHVMKKRSPEILTGIGVAGMITTVILAVKATPKAMELIEEEKLHKEKEAHEGGIFTEDDEKYAFNLTPIETVKAVWKPYIPAAMTGVVSVACIIGANSVHVRRNAALATAYQLSTTAFADYREKVVETIGEKKEKTVREKVSKEKLEKNPVSKSEVYITDSGNTLCYEPLSGRYFKSDINKIRSAVNDINEKMFSQNYVSLNEFYGLLDLSYTTLGDELGWEIYDGNLKVEFTSHIADDGTPCIVIEYLKPPKYEYSKFA